MWGISWLAEEQLLETGFSLWNEFLRFFLVASMPSLSPAYHCFCKYAFFFANVTLLLPVCPRFCQCTIIIVNKPLLVVNLSFLLPVCPPYCQCTNIVANMPFLVVSMSFLLPVCPPYCHCTNIVANMPLLVVSVSFLLPVCRYCSQYALLVASVPSCLFKTYLTVQWHPVIWRWSGVCCLTVLCSVHQTCCYLLTAATFGCKIITINVNV